MPTYDFVCSNGHVHERFNIAEDDTGKRPCPECLQPSERALTFTRPPVIQGGTPKFHRNGTK